MLKNPLPAFSRRLATFPLVMRFDPLIIPLERAVRRISNDRFGVLDIAGQPSIQITVPGRKSGIPRTTSLLYVPEGDDILLVGSNWGRPKHPVWSANLAAAETATVQIRGEEFETSIETLTGAERDKAWQYAIEVWPGYQMEYELAEGREFRLFRLRRLPRS
ncbi:nitroreductase family deazaflavin-dependent oxidoreductase [Antrihabitans spumae]|uniref:Nitroreductase family deazaflavin-dependent oxidoreductase n=1 Tax=Antrihabitans spumae TaxID=3373370 RepID=A0ABW7K040_9NOCA